MIELIALIIFVISFGGIVWILARKIPVLVQMPEVEEGIQKEKVFHSWKIKAKSVLPDKIIVLKLLSKIRVWVLKLEKYIDGWLQKIRKRTIHQKQNNGPKPPNGPL